MHVGHFVCLFVCYYGLKIFAKMAVFGLIFDPETGLPVYIGNFFFKSHLRIFRSFDWPRPFFRIPTFVAFDNSTFFIAFTLLKLFTLVKLYRLSGQALPW